MYTKVDELINTFIGEISEKLREFTIAYAMHSAGYDFIQNMNDGQEGISLWLGKNVYTERIRIPIVKAYSERFPFFLTEVFQNQFVQIFNDYLNALFDELITLHFSKKRQFLELKTQVIKVDFSNMGNLISEIRKSLLEDFKFKDHKERLNLINRVFNPDLSAEEYLMIVKKHIHIRNAVQHRNGYVDGYILEKLGTNKIVLLDVIGKDKCFALGEKMLLFPTELEKFKKSLIMLSQTWLNNIQKP